MQVTFTNNTTGAIFLSAIYMTIQAGHSITTRRTRAQLDAEQQLKKFVQGGQVILAFATETGDNAQLGVSGPALSSYTTAGRPAASAVPTFTSIWDSDLNITIWSDGVNWHDNDGNII